MFPDSTTSSYQVSSIIIVDGWLESGSCLSDLTKAKPHADVFFVCPPLTLTTYKSVTVVSIVLLAAVYLRWNLTFGPQFVKQVERVGDKETQTVPRRVP